MMPVFKTPLQLTWDITNVCPAKCIHCYNASGPEKERATKILIHKGLDNILEIKPLYIGIGGGEPLTSPHLDGIINTLCEVLGKHMPKIVIGTNGLLIKRKEDLLKKIVNIYDRAPYAILFYLSLHGSNSLIHDKVMGINGAFKSLMEGVITLKKYGIPFGFGVTPLKTNFHDLDNIVQLALKTGATAVNISQFVPTGRGTYDLDLTKEEYRYLTNWIVQKNREVGAPYVFTHEHYIALVNHELLKNEFFIGCTAGIYQIAIKPNGDLVPCPLLPVKVGNIVHDRIADVWLKSPILLSLRNRTSHGEPCGSCPLKYKCGGCRSVAYAYTGSYKGADVKCPYSESDLENVGVTIKQLAVPKIKRAFTAMIKDVKRFAFIKLDVPYLRADDNALVVLNRYREEMMLISGKAMEVYELIPDADKDPIWYADLREEYEQRYSAPFPQDELIDLLLSGIVIHKEGKSDELLSRD
jgi:radical SAM protein with 4Fe4S-binding SPASM domain